jgi:hypothetical protein
MRGEQDAGPAMPAARDLEELSNDIVGLMITPRYYDNEFLGEQIDMIFDRITASGWAIVKQEALAGDADKEVSNSGAGEAVG